MKATSDEIVVMGKVENEYLRDYLADRDDLPETSLTVVLEDLTKRIERIEAFISDWTKSNE